MLGEGILVTDATIWIDLDCSGLLEATFKLPYRFVTTDFVVEELEQPDGPSVLSLGLRIVPLTVQQEQLINAEARSRRQLSLSDHSVLIVAIDNEVPLLTGDKHLRSTGEKAGLVVHGSLWLLDELVSREVIEASKAAEALRAMLVSGRRLPPGECERRLKDWDGTP